MTYQIHCACGAVEAKAEGEPVMQVFCHCQDCRDWLGAPVHAATVWPAGTVTITRGADQITTYKRTEQSHRKSCSRCGAAVMVDHPGAEVVDVLASRLDGLKFAPAMHVFYAERMVDFPDDLPKFDRLPPEMGE